MVAARLPPSLTLPAPPLLKFLRRALSSNPKQPQNPPQSGAEGEAAATPARAKKELPAVGDRVALALDDEDGVVTKVAGGWISVKLDDGTVEKFRSTELRY